jgi:small multidrug resistance family-3 protein
MSLLQTAVLFIITAVMEIVGCFLPYLWLKQKTGAWVLIPAAGALAAFVWLLSLHPAASGRIYAAYGGVYVATAIAWLWLVDGVRPSAYDIAGSAIALVGMGIIVLGWRASAA